MIVSLTSLDFEVGSSTSRYMYVTCEMGCRGRFGLSVWYYLIIHFLLDRPHSRDAALPPALTALPVTNECPPLK